MWKPKLNPVTERRLRRFKSIRRSYWSFWALIALYGVSLISELISNDRPLFVNYDGAWYFPAFAFYPDDAFTGSGLNTRPDYKAINDSPRFRENEDNYMIFAPIPYGPFETVSARDIELEKTVTVEARRKQLVGSVSVDNAWNISRSTAAYGFMGLESDRDARGKPMFDFLSFTQAFQEAVSSRFENKGEQDPFEEILTTASGLEVKASLSAFRPRARPASSVRITLREEIGDGATAKWVFRENALSPSRSNDLWSSMSDEEQNVILGALESRRGGETKDTSFTVDGLAFNASLEMESVRFPFRPVGDHYFGLDSSGRDVLTRILYGMRIALNFGLALVIGTMGVGVFIGGLQGYKGGLVDLGGQRLIEIWESLPFLYIMIFMGSVFGRGFLLLLIVYGIFNWIPMSYYIRGEFLKLRKQPFVEAAHCLGLPGWKIMSRHILPNSIVPIVTLFPFLLVGAIFSLSALDYLGFGLPPPTPSWGELLAQAQESRSSWWLVTFPTAILVLVILLGVFIGEGIRAAFDPRVNSRFES